MRVKLYLIYLVYNITNGKYYVGLTNQRLSARWACHCYDARKGSTFYFHQAIRKYGVGLFVLIILNEGLTVNEAKQLETLWIITLRSYDPEVGYNLTYGGSTGGRVNTSPETRAKLRENFIRNNPMKNPIFKAKRVALQTGKPSNTKGKHYRIRSSGRVCYWCFKPFILTNKNTERVFCSLNCSAIHHNIFYESGATNSCQPPPTC
jgi:group I intron endonuclease